jgi:hypothetical protein
MRATIPIMYSEAQRDHSKTPKSISREPLKANLVRKKRISWLLFLIALSAWMRSLARLG